MNEKADIKKQAYIALVQIDKLLKKYNIFYVLLAGSALGAVRHQGFIPWDDDIDIGTFYEDQERVSAILENELEAPFQWVDLRVKPNYTRMYGKVTIDDIGCIDVFPLIKTSNSRPARRCQWLSRRILFNLYKTKIKYKQPFETKGFKYKIKRVLARPLAALFSKEQILMLIRRNEMAFINSWGDNIILTYMGPIV